MNVRLALCLTLVTLLLCFVPGRCGDRNVPDNLPLDTISFAGGRNADRPLVGALTGGGNRPRPPIRFGSGRRCLQYDSRGRERHVSRDATNTRKSLGFPFDVPLSHLGSEQVSCRGTFVVNIPTLCSKLAGGASPIAAVHTSAINMKLHFVVCLAFITLIHFRVPGCCADFKDIERGGAFYAGGRDADQPLVGAITGGDGNRPRPPIRVGPSRRCLQYDYRGRCVYWSGIG
ncbi:hypothetical protein C7M84_011043 [Penaeus vannamei]|uniref:Secreted protein n=1 Tax=Penaeus vannamei TaxID=6689 RepID=A0A423T330_PENVA|nr:hypothetical protein C7M84_011043 [Penaeus vannamei]